MALADPNAIDPNVPRNQLSLGMVPPKRKNAGAAPDPLLNPTEPPEPPPPTAEEIEQQAQVRPRLKH